MACVCGVVSRNSVSNDFFVQQIKQTQKIIIYLDFFLGRRHCDDRSSVYTVVTLNKKIMELDGVMVGVSSFMVLLRS